MTTTCVFCQIIDSPTTAQVVAETETTLSFLDESPLFFGHTLVVPKQHVETIMDLDDKAISDVFLEVRRVSLAVQQAMGSNGIFNAINNIVSQSVPHLHVHVVPRNNKDGLRGFMWPRKRYESLELAATTADRIKKCL